MAIKTEHLREHLEREATFAQAKVDKLREALAGDDPAYALEWSQDAFGAAARVSVTRRALATLDALEERGEDAEAARATLTERLEEEVVRGARWPSNSTSPPSNYANQQVLAAQAELLAKLRGDL